MSLRAAFSRIPVRGAVLVLIGALIGAGAGYWYGFSTGDVGSLKSVRYDGGFRFINPPLYTEVPEDLAFPTYSPLKERLSSLVDEAIADRRATDVGIYFRDLDEGRWIGVNEQHDFAPGSLLKVATLMTALRAVDANPARLTYTLRPVFGDTYEAAPQTYYPPAHPIAPGGSYSVDELLTHLIVESDNRAADALDYYFGISELERTLDDMNVPIPQGPADEANSPQDYSHFFAYSITAPISRVPHQKKHSSFSRALRFRTDSSLASPPARSYRINGVSERFRPLPAP